MFYFFVELALKRILERKFNFKAIQKPISGILNNSVTVLFHNHIKGSVSTTAIRKIVDITLKIPPIILFLIIFIYYLLLFVVPEGFEPPPPLPKRDVLPLY